MLDFITGWILGKSMKKETKPIEPIEYIPIEPKEEELKVYKYVYLADLYDFDATLEGCYSDYEDVNLITLYKDGHTLYYLEVYVPMSDEYYGKSKLVDFI